MPTCVLPSWLGCLDMIKEGLRGAGWCCFVGKGAGLGSRGSELFKGWSWALGIRQGDLRAQVKEIERIKRETLLCQHSMTNTTNTEYVGIDSTPFRSGVLSDLFNPCGILICAVPGAYIWSLENLLR